MKPGVVCLLPARNASVDLPDWFACVSQFADAVVALDDGSTDDTLELLASQPLVKRLITNPPRVDYRGWDDAANRNRLLATAGELSPRWIMQLDADERIPTDDAAALRAFVHTEADPRCAYLFPVFRMIDDLEHYDRARIFVGRLFAYQPGQTLPTERLHFVALPTSVPKSRWVRTTIRIQHLGSLTPEHRRRRFEKYRQADPARTFQPSYSHLLQPPADIRKWFSRSPHLPVIAHACKPQQPPTSVSADPTLSVIVISQNDEAVIEGVVDAIVTQECTDPFEVIVVTSGSDRTAAIVRAGFPEVHVVELDRPVLPGAARNAGLAVARGRYASFPGAHVRLTPGSLAARIRAHELGWPMVTGTMLNGTDTWVGWASYFLDNTTTLRGRPSEPLDEAPVRCSYLREILLEVGGFPEDMRAGEDTAVNNQLFARGYGAYRSQDVELYHHSPSRTVTQLVKHHFQRGRALGRLLFVDPALSVFPARGFGRYVVVAVPGRLRAIRHRVDRWAPELRWRVWLCSPLIVLGAVSAWAGACYEVGVRAPRSLLQRVRRRGGAPDETGPRPTGAEAPTAS